MSIIDNQRRADDLASLEAGLDALEATDARKRHHGRKVLSATWPPVLAVVVLLGLWELGYRSGVKPSYALPSPMDVALVLRSQLRDGTLLDAMRTSLTRGGLGFLIALAIGTPLGILIARAYMLLQFTFTGHHFLMLYMPYLLRYMAAAAGVLTLWELWQVKGTGLLLRLRSPQRLAGVVAVGAVLAVVGAQAWQTWLPQPAGGRNKQGGVVSGAASLATFAHAEYLPNGAAPRYRALTMSPAFPANAIISAIDGKLGADAEPVVLSSDQRLFSFKAYRSYLPPRRESSNAATRWDDRKLVVDSFARITDPAALAQAMSHTEFGRVDALVLNQKDDNTYTWNRVEFHASAFAGPQFSAQVVQAVRSSQLDKPARLVVITRKG